MPHTVTCNLFPLTAVSLNLLGVGEYTFMIIDHKPSIRHFQLEMPHTVCFPILKLHSCRVISIYTCSALPVMFSFRDSASTNLMGDRGTSESRREHALYQPWLLLCVS